MAVAIHLIEALTLITILGIVVSSTVIVVIADRAFALILFVLWPLCQMLALVTSCVEATLIAFINVLVFIANNFGLSSI